MNNDKIKPDDTIKDILKKMSNGNPGAITALSEVMNEKSSGEFMNFVTRLDLHNIYGTTIWIGFDEHCDKDPTKFYEKVMSGDLVEELLE